MVNENAGQLFADRFGKQNGCNRGIHAAGQSAEHFTGTDFLTELLDRGLYERSHLPASAASADFVYKVTQHRFSFCGMHNFRMELCSVKLFLRTGHSCYRTHTGMSRDLKAFGSLCDIIRMAHPGYGLFGNALKQDILCIYRYICVAVFADRCSFHFSAKHVSHQLRTIADTQDGNTHFKNLFRATR